MQSPAYILIEKLFESALLVTGFIYLTYWMSGRKLKNREVLFLFAMGLGMALLLNLLMLILPFYVVIILSFTPLLFSNLKRFLLRRRHP